MVQSSFCLELILYLKKERYYQYSLYCKWVELKKWCPNWRLLNWMFHIFHISKVTPEIMKGLVPFPCFLFKAKQVLCNTHNTHLSVSLYSLRQHLSLWQSGYVCVQSLRLHSLICSSSALNSCGWGNKWKPKAPASLGQAKIHSANAR